MWVAKLHERVTGTFDTTSATILACSFYSLSRQEEKKILTLSLRSTTKILWVGRFTLPDMPNSSDHEIPCDPLTIRRVATVKAATNSRSDMCCQREVTLTRAELRPM